MNIVLARNNKSWNHNARLEKKKVGFWMVVGDCIAISMKVLQGQLYNLWEVILDIFTKNLRWFSAFVSNFCLGNFI